MTKEEIREFLISKHICNDLDIVRKGHPMIGFFAPTAQSRCTRKLAVTIKGKRLKTDNPMDHGSKTYAYIGKLERRKAYSDAFDFVKTLFPDIVMVQSPFSKYCYVPECDLEKAMKK